jgi:hypothetical protein
VPRKMGASNGPPSPPCSSRPGQAGTLLDLPTVLSPRFLPQDFMRSARTKPALDGREDETADEFGDEF